VKIFQVSCVQFRSAADSLTASKGHTTGDGVHQACQPCDGLAAARKRFGHPTTASMATSCQYKDMGIVPLSAGQRQMLCLFQDASLRGCTSCSGKAQYNVPTVFQIEGHLHAQALKAALQDVAQRHEVLRVTYGSDSGVRPPSAEDAAVGSGTSAFIMTCPSQVGTSLASCNHQMPSRGPSRHRRLRLIPHHGK
jgi:hypothetical protein